MPNADRSATVGRTSKNDVARQRFSRLREVIDLGTGSAGIITDLADVRWLTSFSGSNGWLFVDRDDMVLLTDGRYTAQARSQIELSGANASVIECSNQAAMIETCANLLGTQPKVQFQDRQISYQLFRSLEAAVSGELTPMDLSAKYLRRFKDDQEIALIERACRIADRALADCVSLLAQRVTECALRDELEYKMRQFGADGPSYDTIVATGPINAARPHHAPTTTIIEEGHTVIIDVGALVEGYHSDMTRSFVVGNMNSEQRLAYEAVAAAQAAGVAQLRSGMPVAEIDSACRQVLREAGLAEFFTHGTGHGVGLVIHEEPFINSTASEILRPGDVVTVEPGVYRGGFGGLRVEDLLVVTENGSRTLNTFPKDPTCPPLQPTI